MRASFNHAKLLKLLVHGAAAALIALAPTGASAGKFKVLYSFCVEQPGCDDGANGSTGPLVRDAAGNFYGTTPDGKAFVLKRKDTGKYRYNAIWNFKGGAPSGGMIIDTQGNLYGWASHFYVLSYGHGAHHNRWEADEIVPSCQQQPDCGTGFRGTLTYAGAASGAPWDGVSPLYAAMGDGGLNGAGTVIELDHTNGWTETVLYNFCSQKKCADGTGPAGVLLDQNGNLYGSATFGGTFNSTFDRGAGLLFELSPAGSSWTYTVLHAFCSEADCTDGAVPMNGLAQDANRNLFGTTSLGGGTCKPGGAAGCGVLYSLVPNGEESQETVLYTFCQLKHCRDGLQPFAAPLLDEAGDIFGTATEGGNSDIIPNGGGTAYEFTGTEFRILHSFCSQPNCSDGWDPFVGLSPDGSGHLFGTAGGGGAFNNGVVYELTP